MTYYSIQRRLRQRQKSFIAPPSLPLPRLETPFRISLGGTNTNYYY